jgi:hypothetical protein
MRVSTALRIAGIIIVAKAVLIGIVCWRRAEILDLRIGGGSWIGMIAILAVGIAMAAGRLHHQPTFGFYRWCSQLAATRQAHDVGAASEPVVEALACRAAGDGDADRDADDEGHNSEQGINSFVA